MTYEEWLRAGVEAGYCTRVVCDTHDGTPMTEEEAERFEAGWDPCLFIVRVEPPDELRAGR